MVAIGFDSRTSSPACRRPAAAMRTRYFQIRIGLNPLLIIQFSFNDLFFMSVFLFLLNASQYLYLKMWGKNILNDGPNKKIYAPYIILITCPEWDGLWNFTQLRLTRKVEKSSRASQILDVGGNDGRRSSHQKWNQPENVLGVTKGSFLSGSVSTNGTRTSQRFQIEILDISKFFLSHPSRLPNYENRLKMIIFPLQMTK